VALDIFYGYFFVYRLSLIVYRLTQSKHIESRRILSESRKRVFTPRRPGGNWC